MIFCQDEALVNQVVTEYSIDKGQKNVLVNDVLCTNSVSSSLRVLTDRQMLLHEVAKKKELCLDELQYLIF